MSKIKLEAPFRQFRGKICKHSDIIFKQMYGETFTSQICNPYTGDPSTAQATQRTRFATAKANVAALTPTEVDAYKNAFKKQTKYKSLSGYMMAQEMAKI
jgi:23S rRNA A1618 N6-methylase RlmF